MTTNPATLLRATGLPFLAWLISAGAAPAAEWKLTLRAGEHDRGGSLVAFTAPAGLRGAALLTGGGGAPVPVQIDDAGRAVFIAPPLARGAAKTFTLGTAENLPATITAEKSGGALEFAAGGRPFFTFQMEPGPVPEGTAEGFAHGAHLHPVFSPSGRLVTGNHPPDHPHQRGIWFAWTHTEFEGRAPDFWNMGKDKSGKLTGEVRFDKLLKSWSGPVQGGFTGTHRWMDHTGGAEKVMLLETWEVAAYRAGAANVIDFTSTQTCAGAEPVKLPEYHYGGLGVRGSALWDAVDKVSMLTSNGHDRIKGDRTKSKWVWLGGDVDGQTTGITVLIHPSNFRFPQPLRLNPKNPQLCIAPSQGGDWSIEPGTPYLSRYRIVIMDGKADAALLERLWQDYAEPATVEVK